jgi:hypothetical protein
VFCRVKSVAERAEIYPWIRVLVTERSGNQSAQSRGMQIWRWKKSLVRTSMHISLSLYPRRVEAQFGGPEYGRLWQWAVRRSVLLLGDIRSQSYGLQLRLLCLDSVRSVGSWKRWDLDNPCMHLGSRSCLCIGGRCSFGLPRDTT